MSQQVYVSYERIRDNRFMFLTKELETKWVGVRGSIAAKRHRGLQQRLAESTLVGIPEIWFRQNMCPPSRQDSMRV